MTLVNDFSKIDAQDEVSRLAQMTTEEMQEANDYYDALQHINDMQDMFNDIMTECEPELLTLHAQQDLWDSL